MIHSPVKAHPQPPPPALTPDDPSAADPARARLSPKSRFPLLLSLPNLRKPSSSPLKRKIATHSEQVQPATVDLQSDVPHVIHLDASKLDQDVEDQDRYEWAILYENQRGITLFSIPYYSHMSLLPHDPSPFTLPNTSRKRREQPPISLSNYPLPDGNWRWVSRAWMIDMRSDSGEVQHDGFEYNWVFRRHNWHAEVGIFSAGGWVRRRRWVRLMMRPGKKKVADDVSDESSLTADSLNGTANWRHRQSMVSSLMTTTSVSSYQGGADITPDDVWVGDDLEADWQRCRKVMRKFGRDGLKLEIWRAWLGYYHPDHSEKFTDLDVKGKRREKQWTEDDGPLLSELMTQGESPNQHSPLPPQEYIIPVLRKYGQTLLHLFVFPESRAQFLKLIALAGLLPQLNIALGIGFGTSEIDFWSYASSLGEELGVAEIPESATRDVTGIPEAAEGEEQLSREEQAGRKLTALD